LTHNNYLYRLAMRYNRGLDREDRPPGYGAFPTPGASPAPVASIGPSGCTAFLS
jgi:hypothetical protein